MIIAIDETGDFSPNSTYKSFFVAVLLQQQKGKLDIKKRQYELWLKTIPIEKFNSKNEVKGSELNEDELYEFTEMVYSEEPCVANQIIYFLPSENPESLMKSIKKIEVKSIERIAELARVENKPELVNFYKKLSIWYKNAKKMNYQHFMKLILLRRLVNKSFENAVGVSILYEMVDDSNSENLLNLEFKIDKDFIKGREAGQYWKELLRNSFHRYNQKNSIPAFQKWKEDSHPFLDKYEGRSANELNFSKLFRENCNFLESDEHWEIQIADITGIIINRYLNRNKAQKAFENLNKFIKSQIIELNLNDTSDIATDPEFI